MNKVTRITSAQIVQIVLESKWFWSLFFAAVTSWVFSTRVERPNFALRKELQEAIVAGSADEPYRFRVLIPYLSDLVTRGLSSSVGEYWVHAVWFLALNSMLLTIVFSVIWDLSDKLSLHGRILATAIASIAWNVALYDHYYQPWSVAEAALVALAFLLLRRNLLNFLPLVCLVATLNRDTGLLIPISVFLYLMATSKQQIRSHAIPIALSLFSSLILFAALRVSVGPADMVNSLEQILQLNTSPRGLFYFALNICLLALPIIIASFSQEFRRSMRPWMVAFSPQFVLIVIFGIWAEVRLLVPYLVFLIPQLLALVDRNPRQNSGQI